MSNPAEMPDPDESVDFVMIGCYAGMEQAFERALVILAMGLACQIEKAADGAGFLLLADPLEAPRIEAEIGAYEREQAVPVPVVEIIEFDAGVFPTVLWVLGMCVVFWWQREDPAMVAMSVSSPQGIFAQGEWWRPFTALFLHADVMHLLSNIGTGVLLGQWVCRSLGPWFGWLLVLMAGTLGNALNAALRIDDPFSSMGASTAVFGALGLLTGVAVFQVAREQSSPRRFRHLIPLAGGLVLLSWMGVGSDPRTDVGGHVCGFAVGILLGLAAGWLRQGTGSKVAAAVDAR